MNDIPLTMNRKMGIIYNDILMMALNYTNRRQQQ